jgi:hypothetical protein
MYQQYHPYRFGSKNIVTGKTSHKPDDQPNEASAFSYLPVALAASFDQVMNKTVVGSQAQWKQPSRKGCYNWW